MLPVVPLLRQVRQCDLLSRLMLIELSCPGSDLSRNLQARRRKISTQTRPRPHSLPTRRRSRACLQGHLSRRSVCRVLSSLSTGIPTPFRTPPIPEWRGILLRHAISRKALRLLPRSEQRNATSRHLLDFECGFLDSNFNFDAQIHQVHRDQPQR